LFRTDFENLAGAEKANVEFDEEIDLSENYAHGVGFGPRESKTNRWELPDSDRNHQHACFHRRQITAQVTVC
jgi:hypothetical protein